MVPADHPQRRKRTKSELLRLASLQEYVEAHAKPNGHGWKGFFRSNLFASLVIFLLTQTMLIAGLAISFYYRTTSLSEWKGETTATLLRMDEQGSHHAQNEIEKLREKISRLEVKMDKVEDQTKHIEVIESEHRRLTKDVEDLRNGKK